MTTIAETAAETIIQKEWTLFGFDKKRPNLLFFPIILIIIFYHNIPLLILVRKQFPPHLYILYYSNRAESNPGITLRAFL